MGPLWGLFWIILEKGPCQFFNISIIYHHGKKKNRQTDAQIDNSDSIRPSVGRGCNTYQPTKNQFTLLISSWDTANFRILQPEWAYPFMTKSIPIFLNQFLISMNFGLSTLVGQRPMKSLLSVCLSICLSVRPSLSFLKFGSLAFSDNVYDDSWPRYLVTCRARFLKKRMAVQIWTKWTKIRPKTRFFAIF